MKNKNERITKLIDLLKEQDTISIKQLADNFHVSEMTIRRDLKILKENDVVERVYGKASLKKIPRNDISDEHYELLAAQTKHNEEKLRIGKYAASLVQQGDILILDTGSTTEKIAQYLQNDLDITVMCYNYNTLAHLMKKPYTNIIFPGGYYHPNGQFFESLQGIKLIEEIRANKLFLSASGIHKTLGITCSNNYEVLTKRSAIQSSRTKIIVSDSSKFGKIRSSYFATLEDVDSVITDTSLSQEWQDCLRQLGIELIMV